MKIVIIGAGNLFINLIAGCMLAEDCEIVGVLRHERVRLKPVDRYLKDIFNPSKEYLYIKSHNLNEIKVHSANSAEFKKEILKLNPDIILVGSWSEKLKKHIIDLPKIATINTHPSLLPKYRGANPYFQAILNGERTSGVTFHLMDENLDTGPILMQKTVLIEKNDTGKELRERIGLETRKGIAQLLQKMNEEIIVPQVQNPKLASYFGKITQDDIMLDVINHTADEVSARIRGLYPWTRCYLEHNTHFFIPNPYRLEIIEPESDLTEQAGKISSKSSRRREITVVCKDGKLLRMQGVKIYGILKPLTALYIKLRCKTIN